MPEEWLEIAYINFDKAILHGRATAGHDEHGCRREIEVEQILTAEQIRLVQDMNTRHQSEMHKLLGSFVERAAAPA